MLVILKFGGAHHMLKGRSALGSNNHPIKTNTNTIVCVSAVDGNDPSVGKPSNRLCDAIEKDIMMLLERRNGKN